MAIPAPPAAGAALTPDDPLYPETPETLGQWGLRQVRAEAAWALSTGSGAIIAVVDNGVALDHPDLAANLLPGATFVDCDNPNGCGDGSWRDSDDALAVDDHGTHVAGIAAAVTGNGRGVAGTAPDARLIPVNVFDGSGADSADVARGIRWAVDRGAHVVNLSLGQPPGVGQALYVFGDQAEIEEAVAYAHSRDVVVVAAAGNETFPLCDYPSFNEGVLCVAATDSAERPADYSNLPNKEDQLVVRAPGGGTLDFLISCGGGIVSTVPAGFGDDFCGYDQASTDPARPEYTEHIGTSMAAPHVSAVAALLVARGCTRTQVLDRLTATARHPVTGARGTYSPDYGMGIVDAEAAVTAAAAPAAQGGCTPPTATETGSVSGIVVDADSGARLAGVRVDLDTGQSAVTKRNGRYRLLRVPAGSRVLGASLDGYRSESVPTEVPPDDRVVVNVALEPE